MKWDDDAGRSVGTVRAGRAIGFAALAFLAVVRTAAAAEFDPPEETRRIAANDGTETICTRFSDLVVVERRDGPSSVSPVIVDDPKFRCGSTIPASAHDLGLANRALLGRAGVMLFFSDMDPNGATAFAVVEASERRVVFEDTAIGEPLIRSAEFGQSAYRIVYRRAFDASCSLRSNAKACWAQMVREGKIMREMAGLAPSSAICAASYRAQKAPADDPSIITWTHTVDVHPGGRVTQTARHDFGCLPRP